MKSFFNQYILEHTIICIGRNYSDMIVDAPIEFIKTACEFGFYISEILWWERIKISDSSKSLGYGGPADPRDGTYFFSETDISKRFHQSASFDDYNYYLSEIYKTYPNHDLYPSFTLCSFK